MSSVDALGRLVERGDELVEQHVAQAEERAGVDGILEPRERGLAGQIVVVDRAVAEQLEDRIAPQQVVVVLVGVVGQDAVHPHADHFQERVTDVADVPPVGEALGQLPVSPNRSSSWRNGSSPASLETWAAEGSTTTGFDVPKSSAN